MFAWRVRKDTAAGIERIAEAEALHWRPARVDLARSRLLVAAGNETGAEAAARRAMASAEDAAERVEATVWLGSVIVARALPCRLDDPAAGSSDTTALREVVELLIPIVRAEPGLPSATRELVTAATPVADGPALLEAWRSYYLVGTGNMDDGPLATSDSSCLRAAAPCPKTRDMQISPRAKPQKAAERYGTIGDDLKSNRPNQRADFSELAG